MAFFEYDKNVKNIEYYEILEMYIPTKVKLDFEISLFKFLFK